MKTVPTVSVVIPTHNRSESICRMLSALALQAFPLNELEVVVVADGCTDDTVEVLNQCTCPFQLQFFAQSSKGPAVARNKGASLAKGQLLIFLDDDIEPSSNLIQAHVDAIKRSGDRVSVGYLPPILKNQKGFFLMEIRRWWEAMFQTMRQPGHRFSYTTLLSGNFALHAALFARAGGFDASLWCHEDYELGIRLLKAGASFSFTNEAWGYHHEKTDLDRSLSRKFQEGRADIAIGYLHPDLRSVLPLINYRFRLSRFSRLLRLLAFRSPRLGDLIAGSLRHSLDWIENARAYQFWRKRLDDLLDYWYWRGVAQEIGTSHALREFLQSADSTPESSSILDLDLYQGLDASESRLDNERPMGVRIWYGSHFIGEIAPKTGVEPLRGVHLRRALAIDFAWAMLTALTLENQLDLTDSPQDLEAFHAH